MSVSRPAANCPKPRKTLWQSRAKWLRNPFIATILKQERAGRTQKVFCDPNLLGFFGNGQKSHLPESGPTAVTMPGFAHFFQDVIPGILLLSTLKIRQYEFSLHSAKAIFGANLPEKTKLHRVQTPACFGVKLWESEWYEKTKRSSYLSHHQYSALFSKRWTWDSNNRLPERMPPDLCMVPQPRGHSQPPGILL